MNKNFLAIDIGTTFVKSALLRLDERRMEDIRRFPTPMKEETDGEVYEIPMDRLANLLRKEIERRDREDPLTGVVMSLQMHGMMLWDENNEPLTDYRTWMDGRAAIRGEDGLSAVEHLEQVLGVKSFRTTGMRLNPSHTAAQLHSLREEYRDRAVRLSLLGDGVTEMLTGSPAAVHDTNAQSTAMYDVVTGDWRRDIVAGIGLAHLKLPEISHGTEPVGQMEVNGHTVAIYAAVGDQQASILGAMVRPGELLINVATGGQVIWLEDTPHFGDYETRPAMGGLYMRTISDLPAGHCLNTAVDFLEDIGTRLFGETLTRDKLWSKLLSAVDKVEDAQGLESDIHFHTLGSRGENAYIRGMTGANFTFDRWFYSVYEGMARDYYGAFERMRDEELVPTNLMAFGGVMQKTPVFRKLLEKKFGLPLRLAENREDTLTGLMRLAAWYSGICPTLEDTLSWLEG